MLGNAQQKNWEKGIFKLQYGSCHWFAQPGVQQLSYIQFFALARLILICLAARISQDHRHIMFTYTAIEILATIWGVPCKSECCIYLKQQKKLWDVIILNFLQSVVTVFLPIWIYPLFLFSKRDKGQGFFSPVITS